jgi:hypothetical protein
VEAGITRINRKACQEDKPAPEREKAGMVWPQQGKQVFQVVRSRHGEPEFDQERLQELFRGLLAAETNKVIFRWLASSELSCDAVIALGLADPVGRQSLHTGPCPGP